MKSGLTVRIDSHLSFENLCKGGFDGSYAVSFLTLPILKLLQLHGIFQIHELQEALNNFKIIKMSRQILVLLSSLTYLCVLVNIDIFFHVI